MHIFLTGQIQTGKSTAIRKVLDRMGIPYDGFMTAWRDNVLYMFPASGGKGTAIATRGETAAQTVPGGFDKAGPELLRPKEPAILTVMDEIGYLESGSKAFTDAILRRLDIDVPVLGVLRQSKTTPFLELLRSRPDIKLLTLTEENRDDMPDIIIKLLKDQM